MIISQLEQFGYEDYQLVTPTSIANELLVVMRDHVGEERCVDKDRLCYELFGAYMSELSALNNVVISDLLTSAITKLRKESNCFIVGRRVESTWYYWVLDRQEDVDMHHQQCQKKINGYKRSQRRAQKAYDKAWHNNEYFVWDNN